MKARSKYKLRKPKVYLKENTFNYVDNEMARPTIYHEIKTK